MLSPDSESQRILFPKQLNFESGCNLVSTIHRLAPNGSYHFDLSEMQWVEPFAMLHVATAVGQKIAAAPYLRVRASGHTNGYARFMGFFRELGIADEATTSSPPNHENYLPIQVLNLRGVRADASRSRVAPGRLIENHTRSIARTLARQNYGPLWETLQYALREILRNAAEHSQSDHVLYCGQYWPTQNRVEVAILDEGVGIANSLQRNPKLEIDSEFAALQFSIQPGVSGVSYEGAPIDDNDEWANSGFGLYVVSELCRRGGSLTIISGQSGLLVSPNGEQSVAAMHHGTALRLIIDTSNLRSIAASLALIVARGEKLAREYKFSRSSASGASKKIFD